MTNLKGTFIVRFFYLSSFFAKNKFFLVKIIGVPLRIMYKIIINYLLGIEIYDKTKVGKNLKIFHGQGLVVNKKSVLGDNITLRHCTTIGANLEGKCPQIGNNVNIGPNSCLIGSITIGDNCVIGAGSIVTKSFPENCTVAGNPARIISKNE